MFHLEMEVRRWCREVTPRFSFRSKQVAELEDHVHCAVAELVKDGQSEEAAFRSVIEEFGEPTSLRQEFLKNSSLIWRAMCRVGCHPAARFQYIGTAVLLAVLVSLGVSLRSEAFADWAAKAFVALCLMPMKLFGA